MNNTDNYIPIELIEDATSFIRTMDDDVMIYRLIKKSGVLSPCMEADKFAAYWDFKSYVKYPHALITLYENKETIDGSIEVINSSNAEVVFQKRMKEYYLLLKENNMIGE